MITSPYNFVPLNKEVVMPFWEDRISHVSHDIPFENGVSGVLNVKITAHSPIYVRNGVSDKDKDNKIETNPFNQFQNQFFIPGSSIKGMLRSVMEIMSFGRMGNKVNDEKFSVRDFANSKGQGAVYPILSLSPSIRCGWLSKKEGKYYIKECEKPPGRISHEEIAKKFNNKMDKFFEDKKNLQEDISKSAEFKYKKFGFEKEGLFSAIKDKQGQYTFEDGDKKGTIVLTGQPGERKAPKGKYLEFIFFSPSKERMLKDTELEVIKNLFYAYYEHDVTQQKEDWKWRKPQLEEGTPIPIFFRKNGENIIDMGLSFLYKIIYKNSIGESINKFQNDANSYDLAETIFGYVDEEKNTALKGRVHIGHALLTNGIKTKPFDKSIDEVLSSPKATYYPTYMKQDHEKGRLKGNYATFMNNSPIKGWKRYPIRYSGTQTNLVGTSTGKTITSFTPLNEGAEFSLSISYHNLRQEELGALISAITFHNTAGCYHSVGMAKPLGYGKVLITIENLKEEEQIHYLKAYEVFMNYRLNKIEPDWHKTPQINELVAMVKGSPSTEVDKLLKYMKLSVTPPENDFTDAKKDKAFLQDFSIISNRTDSVKSLTTATDISIAKAKYEIEKTIRPQDNDALKQNTKTRFEDILKSKLDSKKAELLAILHTKRQAQKDFEDKQGEEERQKKKKELNTEGGQADLIFPDFDLDEIVDAIKKHFIKFKTAELSDKQTEQYKNALIKSYKETRNSKKSRWLKKDNKFTEFPWTAISKLLGEEQTKALYNTLTRE
jgi:CRISPR-associated protein (TIGR03986 family)